MSGLFGDPIAFLSDLILKLPALLIAVTVHELAHALVADRLGDPTPRRLGRITLNPLPHLDPLGALAFVLAGFGWAKPVPVNFMNLRRPKEDMVWVAGAGPATNLLLAAACGLLFRLMVTINPGLILHLRPGGGPSGWNDPAAIVLVPLLLMLLEAVKWNVVLAVFNMIPIPPLDGGRVMVGLLPDRQSAAWASIEPFGFFIIIALVFLDPFGFWSQIISPIIINIMMWIVGVNPFFF